MFLLSFGRVADVTFVTRDKMHKLITELTVSDSWLQFHQLCLSFSFSFRFILLSCVLLLCVLQLPTKKNRKPSKPSNRIFGFNSLSTVFSLLLVKIVIS